MCKYVYPGTNKPDYLIHFYELLDSPKRPLYLKSVFPEGRIIADDNKLR